MNGVIMLKHLMSYENSKKIKKIIGMEKYFVTYNQALALKKLGFDEPCMAFYQVEYLEKTPIMVDDENQYRLTGWRTCKNSEIPKHYTSAPLKSQVFEWFRKNHLLGHEILCPFISYSGERAEIINEGKYELYITDEEQLAISDEEFYSTDYFDAESKAIDKLIEIVKNGR